MELNRREALAHISKYMLWTAPATTLLAYTPNVLAQSRPPTLIPICCNPPAFQSMTVVNNTSADLIIRHGANSENLPSGETEILEVSCEDRIRITNSEWQPAVYRSSLGGSGNRFTRHIAIDQPTHDGWRPCAPTPFTITAEPGP